MAHVNSLGKPYGCKLTANSSVSKLLKRSFTVTSVVHKHCNSLSSLLTTKFAISISLYSLKTGDGGVGLRNMFLQLWLSETQFYIPDIPAMFLSAHQVLQSYSPRTPENLRKKCLVFPSPCSSHGTSPAFLVSSCQFGWIWCLSLGSSVALKRTISWLRRWTILPHPLTWWPRIAKVKNSRKRSINQLGHIGSIFALEVLPDKVFGQ